MVQDQTGCFVVVRIFFCLFVLVPPSLSLSPPSPRLFRTFCSRVCVRDVRAFLPCKWICVSCPLQCVSAHIVHITVHSGAQTVRGSVLNSRELTQNTLHDEYVCISHMKICDNYVLHIWSCLLPSKPCKILRWMFPLNTEHSKGDV